MDLTEPVGVTAEGSARATYDWRDGWACREFTTPSHADCDQPSLTKKLASEFPEASASDTFDYRFEKLGSIHLFPLSGVNMSIFTWLTSKFSHRAKSLSRYRSGMVKAQKGDFAGAVVDYTAAAETPGIPSDVLGMALYNRALAYSSLREVDKAADDLGKVLNMPGLPENIKVAASQRRERLRRREV